MATTDVDRSAANTGCSCDDDKAEVTPVAASPAERSDYLESSLLNAVLTLRFNDARRKNAWSGALITAMLGALAAAAENDAVKVVVLTGTGDYYSSGVDFVSSFPLLPPSRLVEVLRASNQRLFDAFILFPKPILVAANGPMIGAAVTSATLCDAIIADPSATFSTPFAALGIVPEGCSSYWFARVMGETAAQRMLGDEGWRPTAAEALEIGMVHDVVRGEGGNISSTRGGKAEGGGGGGAGGGVEEQEHGWALRARAQALAEQWAAEGKQRSVLALGEVQKLLAVNARESEELARAFVSTKFLTAMHRAAVARKKTQLATVFWLLLRSQWIWSRL